MGAIYILIFLLIIVIVIIFINSNSNSNNSQVKKKKKKEVVFILPENKPPLPVKEPWLERPKNKEAHQEWLSRHPEAVENIKLLKESKYYYKIGLVKANRVLEYMYYNESASLEEAVKAV